MKRKIIICVSIFGFLTAMILANMKDIQNRDYIDGEAQQAKGKLEADEVIDLFVRHPVDW